jgi:hypothetical protein
MLWNQFLDDGDADLVFFQKKFFSNIVYENDTFITQFSEENRRLHH